MGPIAEAVPFSRDIHPLVKMGKVERGSDIVPLACVQHAREFTQFKVALERTH